jgi:hypothetical protein
MMIRLELTDGAAPTVDRESDFKSVFQCYPNPSRSSFFIQGPEVKWEIKDVQGRKVPYIQTGNQIIISDGTPGMYFMETIWKGKLFVHKIVIQP